MSATGQLSISVILLSDHLNRLVICVTSLIQNVSLLDSRSYINRDLMVATRAEFAIEAQIPKELCITRTYKTIKVDQCWF